MTAATVTKKRKNPKAPKLFSDELIDQLLAQVQSKDAESILGESGLAGQIEKRLAERMLAAELTHHLDNEAKQGTAGGTDTQWLGAPMSMPAAFGSTSSSRLRMAMDCSTIVDERQRHARRRSRLDLSNGMRLAPLTTVADDMRTMLRNSKADEFQQRSAPIRSTLF